MTFNINIQNFNGPLDLLLFLVQRDQMDIYDIEISKITNDFFKYIEDMNKMNLDVGAEFIFIASMLMKIKSKMLLPFNEDEKDEELISLKKITEPGGIFSPGFFFTWLKPIKVLFYMLAPRSSRTRHGVREPGYWEL